MQTILQADSALLLYIQENLRSPLLTPFMKGVTALGNGGIFWIILTVLLLLFPRTRKAGLTSALALLFSLLINNIALKNLVARTRPYEVIPGLTLLVARARDYSFPSGHTGASVASAWAMARDLPRPWNVLLVILACVIAFSRLYVGIHYPTDVLGGFLTGFLAAALARRLEPVLEARWKKRPKNGKKA